MTEPAAGAATPPAPTPPASSPPAGTPSPSSLSPASPPAGRSGPDSPAGLEPAASAAGDGAESSSGDGAASGAAPVTERATAVVERAGDAVERAAAASGRLATAVIDRLRNDAEYAAERGSTRIDDAVVEKIAAIAAREVPGVHDLGGDAARFFASVRERVGLGDAESGHRGVTAKLEGRTARIGITLVVSYGSKVYPITEQVRAEVIEAVQNMVDLEVTEVNIVVDDVEVPE